MRPVSTPIQLLPCGEAPRSPLRARSGAEPDQTVPEPDAPPIHARRLTLSPAERVALGERIAATAAHIDVATHRLLTQLRDFDACEGWGDQGAISCAHWLSWRTGIALGAAREKVRVANAIGSLPSIDDALRCGVLSYSKARAMTRIANPDNQETLLHLALHMTASQLEKTCRLWRQLKPEPQSATEEPLRRWVSYRDTDDGMVLVQARLHPEEAARVQKAIEISAEIAARSSDDQAAKSRPNAPDGLVAMADRVLQDPKAPPSGAISNRPVEVTLTIDAATLEGHSEGGFGISPPVARRLCCDAGIVPVTVDANGSPMDVGRKTRVIPTALRRALMVRDRGCRFPGCTNRFVDVHHIEHWADGGPTSLSNTIQCCRSHHRLLHEYGYSVELDAAGAAHFTAPDGNPVPPTPDALPLDDGWAELMRANHATGPRISAATNQPHWDGAPVDYDSCLYALDT